jgi:ureidoglycolate dehydrogenase (NAD+)
VDADGNPTTNPKDVRAVRPFGGYKGSDLGLMIDVLCTFLIGTPSGPDIAPMYGDPSRQRLLGGLVGAIDIRRFRDVGAFRAAVSALAARWTSQPAAGEEPVLFPGQPELQTRARRLVEGIPLGVNLIEIFKGISAETSIPWTLYEL